MITIRFMTLSGTFATLREETFESEATALVAVQAHATSGGYGSIKIVDDHEDPNEVRYTARTPGGRSGRNIAFGSTDYV